jgi:hypothetical protein
LADTLDGSAAPATIGHADDVPLKKPAAMETLAPRRRLPIEQQVDAPTVDEMSATGGPSCRQHHNASRF